MKKFLSLLLICCILATGLPVTRADATNAAAQSARLTEIYTSLYPTANPGTDPHYFTVDGEPCTHGDHTTESEACMDCELGTILKSLSQKNNSKFGKAYELYLTSPIGSRTCVAFQRFVWLYVYGARDWVPSDFTYILYDDDPNYSNFSQMQLGDSLYFWDRNDPNIFCHVAVFLSCTENDVTLLDCNWKDGKYGVAIVRIRTVTYSALKDYVFTAKRATTSLTTTLSTVNLDTSFLTLPVGATFDFTAGQALEGTSVPTAQLTWSSSDSAVASVSGGRVTAKGVGQCTVTVQGAGLADTVTISVVQPDYNCAEQWTVLTDTIAPRVDCSLDVSAAAQYNNGNGRYIVKAGDAVQVLAKQTDAQGDLWGFGCGYHTYLNQNIWGWFNLEDHNLGNEQYDFSYVPAKPVIAVSASDAGTAVIAWNPVERATQYDLYQDNVRVRTGLTGTSAEVALQPGQTAQFRLEAINGSFPCSDVYVCKTASATETFTMPQASGTITHAARSISLEGSIIISQYLYIDGFEGIDIEANGGILFFKNEVTEETATPENAFADQKGLTYDAEKDRYGQVSHGIAAKEYGDTVYIRAYVKDSNGNYHYGDIMTYSVRQYCESRLEKSSDQDLKNICLALLHYGAAAQIYFGHNTDNLANSGVIGQYPQIG